MAKGDRTYEVRHTHLRGLSGSAEEEACEGMAFVTLARDGSLQDCSDTCDTCGEHIGPTLQEGIVAEARQQQADERDWERTSRGSLI